MFDKLKHTRFFQYCAALSASAGVTSYTMYTSWPSPTLPIITDADKTPLERPMSGEEASWMVSIFILAGLPLTVVMPQLINKFGRRKILLASGVCLFVPWLIIIFIKNTIAVYVARAIGGLCIGFVSTCVSLYNGEVADDDIRGKLGTSYAFMKLVGSFIILSAGPFVSYTVLAIICGIVPVLFISVFFFMPESPHDLVRNGDYDGARAAVEMLSGTTDDTYIKHKLLDIEETIKVQLENKESFYEFFTSKQFRKVIILMLGIKTLQLFSGGVAIEAYQQSIIDQSISVVTPEISSIIFGVIQFPAVMMSSFVVDRYGRRPITIISALGCAVALIAEGVFFFMQDYMKVNVDAISWLPTTGIVVFIIAYNFGLLPLPYILFGELFPSNIKSTAVSVLASYGTLLNFAVSKSFQPMSTAFGLYTSFWVFAAFCILGAIFVFFFLPETKGRTFDEIQQVLKIKQ